jgi:hypothetical protein
MSVGIRRWHGGLFSLPKTGLGFWGWSLRGQTCCITDFKIGVASGCSQHGVLANASQICHADTGVRHGRLGSLRYVKRVWNIRAKLLHTRDEIRHFFSAYALAVCVDCVTLCYC